MSVDIKSLINKVYKQDSKDNNGKNLEGVLSSGSNIVNSIYNKDTDNLPKEICNLAKNVISLFDLNTNASANATQQVTQQNSEIIEANAKTESVFSSLNTTLQSILDNCGQTEESIKAALEKIVELGGNIEELQAKLDEKIAEIDKQKEILNNESSTSEQRKNAIATILKISGEIDALFAEVSKYKEELESQQDVVVDETKNLETQNEDLDTSVEEGADEVQDIADDTAEIQQGAGQMQIDAPKEQTVGGEQVSYGTSLLSGPQAVATGSLGVQHISAGSDKVAAGSIKQGGAISGLAQTTALLGTIGSKVLDFANNANSVGQYSSEVANLIGSFNSTIEPMIQSVGSWETIISANEELKSYTTEYASQIGMSDEEIKNLNSDNNRENGNSTTESSLSFKEFAFDTKKFKEAFEIKE